MELQQLVAIGITMLAAVYLIRRSIVACRGQGGCGSCSGCPQQVADGEDRSLPVRKQLYSLSDSRTR